MIKLFGLVVLFIFGEVHASIVVGRILEIDEARTSSEPTLFYMDDGSVLRLRSTDSRDLDSYLNFIKHNTTLKLTVNSDRHILAVEDLGITDGTHEAKLHSDRKSGVQFEPTILPTDEAANNVFKSLRKDAWNASQCYNRAHVWAYEMHKKSGVNAKKVFLFFTRRYIREFKFDWWFHVAPYAHVLNEAEENERVLDFTFTKKPVSMKVWTDLFMANKVACPVVEKYSQYSKNQEAAFCYLYKTSMYDYQPKDLDTFEQTGIAKTEWVRRELKKAFHDGFGIFF